MSPPTIVVLGAGVIGLTSALKVQEAFNEANVCIVAESFPGDPKSIKYTSLWAVGSRRGVGRGILA
jgi:D-amino-acid oxidase